MRFVESGRANMFIPIADADADAGVGWGVGE